MVLPFLNQDTTRSERFTLYQPFFKDHLDYAKATGRNEMPADSTGKASTYLMPAFPVRFQSCSCMLSLGNPDALFPLRAAQNGEKLLETVCNKFHAHSGHDQTHEPGYYVDACPAKQPGNGGGQSEQNKSQA